MTPPLRICALEPWLGGSHRSFLESWLARSAHAVTIRGLADRSWKWRMRAGAWELARKLEGQPLPDLLLASDYLDLPSFLGHAPASYAQLPTLLYFHENQLTYPEAPEAEPSRRDFSYGFTNVLSCLRADGVAFNSEFHLRDFRDAAAQLLAKLPRPNPRQEFEAALERARVIGPGIEVEQFELGPGGDDGAPLRVLFNHRWEHDKDPLGFLHAIREVTQRGARLELVLLGESFEQLPRGCAEELAALREHIAHQGFVDSRADYAALLASCDVVVSTAQHEFFGMSVLEGLAAGATPLLPKRLSYPVILGEEHITALYSSGGELRARLAALAADPSPARVPSTRACWRSRAEAWSAARTATELDGFCAELVAAHEHE